MKENFGFIERADVVKEIFFHFSEAKSMKEELRLGDDVEFIIQTRNVRYKIFENFCLRARVVENAKIQYRAAGEGGSLQHYQVTAWLDCIRRS